MNLHDGIEAEDRLCGKGLTAPIGMKADIIRPARPGASTKASAHSLWRDRLWVVQAINRRRIASAIAWVRLLAPSFLTADLM